MDTTKMTSLVDQLINDKIQNSFPSLFTKEDVIKVLKDFEALVNLEIESEPKPMLIIAEGIVSDIAETIVKRMTRNVMDYIDDYSLDICGREIEVSDIELNESELTDLIENVINENIG